MYNIIPLILILICLSIIVVIVVRKFSALASVDVENIQAEKEARFKEKIISNRFKRNIIKWNSKFLRVAKVGAQKGSEFVHWSHDKLLDLKDNYKTEADLPTKGKEEVIKDLFAQVEELKKDDQADKAEEKLIEIIGLDSRNIEAFEDLADLYFARKNYAEAEQTFKHILKLMSDDDAGKAAEIYFNLSLVSQFLDKDEETLANIKKALKIESNNPRYLDTAAEMGIIKKDKILALDAVEKLEKINPENGKLPEFKERIREM